MTYALILCFMTRHTSVKIKPPFFSRVTFKKYYNLKSLSRFLLTITISCTYYVYEMTWNVLSWLRCRNTLCLNSSSPFPSINFKEHNNLHLKSVISSYSTFCTFYSTVETLNHVFTCILSFVMLDLQLYKSKIWNLHLFYIPDNFHIQTNFYK